MARRRLSRPERDKACDRLERFVVRARRVMAHSLVQDQMELLQAVADGTFKIKTIKNLETGEYEQRLLMELPDEEAFESFAARLRPFMIRDEVVYWENVIDAMENLAPQKVCDEVIDFDQLRAAFTGVTQGKKTAQAYSVITASGALTDLQLADMWLYSDALHAQLITSAVGNDLGLDERYQAAAGVYARLGAAVSSTYNVLRYLVSEGHITLNKEVFTEPVTAAASIDIPLAGGHGAPVGSTPLPTDLTDVSDLDPAWTPMHEVFEQTTAARKKQEEDAANPCPHCRGTGGVRIRWPDGRITTALWVQQAE